MSPSSSSATDASFDAVIGCIEDIIMGIFSHILLIISIAVLQTYTKWNELKQIKRKTCSKLFYYFSF